MKSTVLTVTSISRLARALAVGAFASIVLAGCIQAQGTAVSRIEKELGGPIWTIDSGEYSVTGARGSSENISLVKSLSATGQRIYRRPDSTTVYAFYALSNGRVVAEERGDEGSLYSYVEVYSAGALGSYDMKCKYLPRMQKVLWYSVELADQEDPNCGVANAEQLLMVLDAAFPNVPGVETTYRLVNPLPDAI